jgi:hypothetical protein
MSRTNELLWVYLKKANLSNFSEDDCHLEGRGDRDEDHRRGGKISSSNAEIRRGQSL